MPDTWLYPCAAEWPVVGTAITRSASTGCSSARRRPISTRASCTVIPSIREPGRGRSTYSKTHPAIGDPDGLAGLDVAHPGRADDVQRAGLRGDDEAVRQPADRQWAHTEGV